MKKLSLGNVLAVVAIVCVSGLVGAIAWVVLIKLLIYFYLYILVVPAYWIFGAAGWNFFAIIWNSILFYAVPLLSAVGFGYYVIKKYFVMISDSITIYYEMCYHYLDVTFYQVKSFINDRVFTPVVNLFKSKKSIAS